MKTIKITDRSFDLIAKADPFALAHIADQIAKADGAFSDEFLRMLPAFFEVLSACQMQMEESKH